MWTFMAVAIVIALDIRASVAILCDPLASPGQKAGQIAFVWLVPILGATLTLYLKRADGGSGADQGTLAAGSEFGYDGPGGHSSHHGGFDGGGDSGGSDGGGD